MTQSFMASPTFVIDRIIEILMWLLYAQVAIYSLLALGIYLQDRNKPQTQQRDRLMSSFLAVAFIAAIVASLLLAPRKNLLPEDMLLIGLDLYLLPWVLLAYATISFMLSWRIINQPGMKQTAFVLFVIFTVAGIVLLLLPFTGIYYSLGWL